MIKTLVWFILTTVYLCQQAVNFRFKLFAENNKPYIANYLKNNFPVVNILINRLIFAFFHTPPYVSWFILYGPDALIQLQKEPINSKPKYIHFC